MVERYRPSPNRTTKPGKKPLRYRRDERHIATRLWQLDSQRQHLRFVEELMDEEVRSVDPETRAKYEAFLSAGGVTAEDWKAWLRGDIEPDQVTGKRGLRVVVSNLIGSRPVSRTRRQSG